MEVGKVDMHIATSTRTCTTSTCTTHPGVTFFTQALEKEGRKEILHSSFLTNACSWQNLIAIEKAVSPISSSYAQL